MVQTAGKPLSLEEFIVLQEGDFTYELVDGEAKPKMAPKRFHSRTQKALLRILDDWSPQKDEVGVEWAVTLTRQGKDWVPVPDLLYVSGDRLPTVEIEDEPCPVPPDLAIEIISPNQTFGEMTEKATDYLAAGVLRVWIVDPRAKSITVFYPDAAPRTFRGTAVLVDELFPDLKLTPQQVFEQAGLPD